MGVYNDLLHPFLCGGDEEKKTDSKIINEILKQIKELQGKIAELEKAMTSLEKDTSIAKQEAEHALATAQLALSNMQAMLAQIEAINSKATQADNKATQALNSINDIRTEISIIARVADSAIDKATEAINKATDAKQTAEEADAKATLALSKNPFLAIYDVTPYAEVRDAINQGRPIFLMEEYQGIPRLIKPCFAQEIIRSNIYLVTYSYAYNGSILNFGYTVYVIDTATGNWSISVNNKQLQPILYSGVNIKTLNNQSILGSGNIDIPGGSLPELELGTAIQIATYKEGTNRYKVFQKVIDLGALPNSTSKTVAHGIDKTKVLKYLSIQGSASQEGFGNTLPLPCVTLGSESVNNNIYVAVGGNNITISTGRDRTAYTGTLTITYVDNTPIT